MKLGTGPNHFSSFADTLSQQMFLYQLPASYSASFKIPEEGTCVLEQKLRKAERAEYPGNVDLRAIWSTNCLEMLQENRVV